MRNNVVSIPVGIIDVMWDIDEYDEIKKAFYIFEINFYENKVLFKNNYYFMNGEICLFCDDTQSEECNLKLLKNSENNKIKLNFCGDILYLTSSQYKLLNESITKAQDKYQFTIKLMNNEKVL